MSDVILSVLDQSPVRSGGTPAQAVAETIRLAQLCESLGYHRFWVSEHHAMEGLAGVAPEVLLARLGAETQHIRLGSGGVMLPHYSPYKVAEAFKLLQTFYPDRIDLGVGRAPGGDQYTAAALRYGSMVGPEHFPNQVADLSALLRDEQPRTPGMEKARAMPPVDVPPALWMLGSGDDSAILAALFGLPYACAQFINPAVHEDVLHVYRQRFRPGPWAERPYAALGVFAICAETEAEARYLLKSRELWYLRLATTPHGGLLPSPEEAASHAYTAAEQDFLNSHAPSIIVGTGEQVAERLRRLAARFGADELIVVSITWDFAARCRSYELLAEAWGMSGSEER